MKTLIVEDDFTSRFLLQEILKEYGTVHIAVNGKEAVQAVDMSLKNGQPYDIICMDIMMPEMDGQTAVQKIRKLEEAKGILSTNGTKIFMTTAHGDVKNVLKAFSSLCDGYLTKPIDKAQIAAELNKFGLIK
jgi:two-component system chemotaxis response regulator CheY